MAVSSNLTLISNVEGTLTLSSIGGGQGASANTDVFIEGSQSAGRRTDNQAAHGFLLDDGVGNDLSAADQHVGVWYWCTHWALVTQLDIAIGSTTANFDRHRVPTSEYPDLGGWLRVWIDVSRTPEATSGSGLAENAARHFGPVLTVGDVGGNAQNNILDAIHNGLPADGLLWDGTGGDFDAFSTFESTNRTGVVITNGGILFALARINIGSATATTFTDSNFVIVFPTQSLIGTTFMGISIDLQNASTAITFTNGSLQAADLAATNKGDFLVTGSSGTFDWDGGALSGLRIITLTSGCSLTNANIQSSGQITAAGADLTGTQVSNYTGTAGTAAVLWNVATDPNGLMDNMTFIKGTGTTHAIELGSNTPSTITLQNHTYSGYNASDGQNDSTIYNNSGKAITIQIEGGGDTPSIRNGAGASTIVNNTVAVTVTVEDTDGVAVQGARVRVEQSSNGALIDQGSTNVSGIFSFSYNYVSDLDVDVVVRLKGYLPVRIAATITSTGLSVPVTFVDDEIVNLP